MAKKSKVKKVKKVGGIKVYKPGTDVNQPIDMKTSGIKMRGGGAATKGLMSRGPMA